MRDRLQVKEEIAQQAISLVIKNMEKRLKKKGRGAFASNHEIFGRAQQELHEYEDAVHLRMTDAEKIDELSDVAVACIWGIASILSGGCDW